MERSRVDIMAILDVFQYAQTSSGKLIELRQLYEIISNPRRSTPSACLQPHSLPTSSISIYPVQVFVRDRNLSPIIDIHLPSPSIKKTHGRQTSYQGACIAKLSISRATHSVKSAGNTPLLRIRGGGRGWLCCFLMKRKFDCHEEF